MRWSAWKSMRAGVQVLSGTSLALAVGCSGEPVAAKPLEPISLSAIEDVESAAQAARRRPQYDDRVALAGVTTPAEPAPADGPWFLRPAGQPEQTGIPPVQQQPVQSSNNPESFANASTANIRPEPVQPIQQPVVPVRPIRRGPPGGWRKAACGRG